MQSQISRWFSTQVREILASLYALARLPLPDGNDSYEEADNEQEGASSSNGDAGGASPRPEHFFQQIAVSPAVQALMGMNGYSREERARGILLPGMLCVTTVTNTR